MDRKIWMRVHSGQPVISPACGLGRSEDERGWLQHMCLAVVSAPRPRKPTVVNLSCGAIWRLVVQEVLEPIAAELGVANGVLDVLVPEVVLDCPGVLAIIGQLEAGGMPQHVGMHGEVEAGFRPDTGHDLPECG